MNTMFRRSLTGTAALMLTASAPLLAHGGHESAFSASAMLHFLAHTVGSPLTWVVLAAAAALVAVTRRSRSSTADR